MKRLLVPAAAAVVALAGASPAMAAPSSLTGSHAAAAAKPTLVVRNSRYGPVLFSGNGRVVYGFTRDPRGGKSRCYGACARAWPVYYKSGNFRPGAGVKQSLLGTTKRRDGRLQITYNGWPLYYYAHEDPGQILCQNVDEFGGLWLVVRPNGQLVR